MSIATRQPHAAVKFLLLSFGLMCPAEVRAVVGGYAVSTSSRIAFIDGDGQTVFSPVLDQIENITGLTNGNVVGRLGADVWRVYTAEGAVVNSRQLDNLGAFTDVVAAGGGGYVALTDANVIFVAADGDTVHHVYDDVLQFGTTLTNGKIVALKGADQWRLYDANGDNVVTRVLDNSGVFNGAAALGGGGYAAVSDTRIIFMAADGSTVNNVVTDIVSTLTSLSNGNAVGRVGADVWKLYSPTGGVLATRPLDNFGTYLGAAPLGNGGYLAYTDANAIFMAADGNSVSQVVPSHLEFVTPLHNGNVAARLFGTDLWQVFDPLGNVLATRSLDNLGTFTGAAPTGLAMGLTPGDFDSDGQVDGDDLAIWRTNFGAGPGANLGQGDADSDGDVDGADFLIWQRNHSTAASATALHAVPEPATGAIAGSALALSAISLRSRQRLSRSNALATMASSTPTAK